MARVGYKSVMREPPAVTRIRRKYRVVAPELDERRRRQWAAAEAREAGYGGVSAVARATGLARSTIHAGLRDLRASRRERVQAAERIRRAGGGRRPLTTTDPALLTALLALIEPATRGDPESPLRWTSKSTAQLADALGRQRHPVSPRTVATLLKGEGYSLQANRKTREGAAHPDRDAQFRYLAGLITQCHQHGQPAVSVDTKKKELVGDFKNGGREWRPQGQPARVRVHDFLDPTLGKAIPYGVYDLANNEGWVSVGIDHDTAEFAVNAIRLWWTRMGRHRFPRARRLLITADGGGSNGPRSRLWKWALQRFADDFDVTLSVCHFPPGTSKWNKIEHRLFSFISQNWRGKPLVSHAAIVNLIAATTTRTGLRVKAALDTR
ncbi:MAG: ISAzo13 family transposase, partial [Acidobacteria bacterium]|nr:ISAzo13 family transposase [Acidobacteriota bacterium]